MISLFTNKNNFNYKSRLAPDTMNIYGRLDTYLKSVISYFHRSNYFVNNKNVLCRVIDIMDIDYNWSDLEILNYVKNNIRNALRPLGISNEYYIDIVPKGSTIIDNAIEIIYLNNLTNIVNMGKINIHNWKQLEPIRFRNHDFRDLYFNHPDRIYTTEDCVVVYDIDIIQLMLMYAYYVRDTISSNNSPSVESFVGKYVLANSINSLADIAILNNYIDKGNIHIKPNQFVPTTSVHINKSKLDVNIINKSIIYESNNSFMELLRNIPLLSKKDAYELLFLENYYETSRSRLYVAVTLLDFLVDILDFIDVDKRDNSAYIGILRYDVKVMLNTHLSTSNGIVNMKIRNTLDVLRRV